MGALPRARPSTPNQYYHQDYDSKLSPLPFCSNNFPSHVHRIKLVHVLRFPNVSGNHCELELVEGYWYVNDLNSRNGTKVNGERVKKQRLIPDDKLSIARHVFQIRYEPASLGAVQTAMEISDRKDIFGKSLLESAGLESKSRRGRHRHGR